MRPIKFRAWDGVAEMCFPSWPALAVLMTNQDQCVKEGVVVEQFTGLTDRNGREIYEGDVVEWLIFPEKDGQTKVRDVVAFGSGAFKVERRCELLGTKEPYRQLEVIGNIHQNPELLKP